MLPGNTKQNYTPLILVYEVCTCLRILWIREVSALMSQISDDGTNYIDFPKFHNMVLGKRGVKSAPREAAAKRKS